MKTPVPDSLFFKKKKPEASNFIKKETVAQVISCEFCEILKNTFFHRAFAVADSKNANMVSGTFIQERLILCD